MSDRGLLVGDVPVTPESSDLLWLADASWFHFLFLITMVGLAFWLVPLRSTPYEREQARRLARQPAPAPPPMSGRHRKTNRKGK